MTALILVAVVVALTLALQPWVRYRLRTDHQRGMPGLFVLRKRNGGVEVSRSRYIPGDMVYVADEVLIDIPTLLPESIGRDWQRDASAYLRSDMVGMLAVQKPYALRVGSVA